MWKSLGIYRLIPVVDEWGVAPEYSLYSITVGRVLSFVQQTEADDLVDILAGDEEALLRIGRKIEQGIEDTVNEVMLEAVHDEIERMRNELEQGIMQSVIEVTQKGG